MSFASTTHLLAAHRSLILELCDASEVEDVHSFDPAALGSEATVGLAVTPRPGASTFAFLRLEGTLSSALGIEVLLTSSESEAAAQITSAVQL